MRRSTLRFLFISSDIRNRILITIGLLILYRFVANIPVPGVNRAAIAGVLSGSGQGQTLIGLLDLLSGGTVSNFGVMAMGVYPYITAQIILQLLVPIIPALQARMDDDPREGRKWMEKWTYYLAIPMSLLASRWADPHLPAIFHPAGREHPEFPIGVEPAHDDHARDDDGRDDVCHLAG